MAVVLSPPSGTTSSPLHDRGTRLSRANSHHPTPRATLTTVTQLGDYQVKAPSPATDNGRPDKRMIVIAVIVLLVLALGGYWFLGGEGTPDETAVEAPSAAPTPAPATAPPPASEPDTEPVELPGLDQSDGLRA